MKDRGPSVLSRACRTIVRNCGALRPTESALVVTDPDTRGLGDLFAEEARKVTPQVCHLTIPRLRIHGEEPPAAAADTMRHFDVIFGLTRMSMAHTRARLEAASRGARYLSLPDYSSGLLRGKALSTDFRTLTASADRLAGLFSRAKTLHLTTALGTDLRCVVRGRTGNSAPGWCSAPGGLASPPDAEANVAPLETESEGTIIVDGSIPCRELGLLRAPISLDVRKGRVVEMRGGRADTLKRVFDRVPDPKKFVVAEIGIGLNPRAKLRGHMLEDEGVLGTVHVGIGANIALGGRNSVPFHLDHVIGAPSLSLDGTAIMKDGRFV